jgi:flagellar protein FliO/FliZ
MQAVTFIFAFVAVLALIVVAAWLVRRFAGNRLGANPSRGRMPRLAVIDAAAVDGRRRLVLVRRDNIEHLLMIGGPTDIVVESNIVRATAGRDQLPQRPSAVEPPPRIAPLPDAAIWAEAEAVRSDDHAPLHAPSQMPEPPPRPMRPAFADDLRRPAPALAERRSDPLAGFGPEPLNLRPDPRPEPRLEPRPEPRSEPRAEPRIEQRTDLRPEPRADIRPEPIPPRMPRIDSEAIPPRMPRSEQMPRSEPIPRGETMPRGEAMPRGEPMPRAEAMPRSEPMPRAEAMMPRPSRQSEPPKMPPMRAPERAVVPPPPAAPPSNASADQNLAEMAQRLEAALRRPAAEPLTPPAAPEPVPPRVAMRSEPPPAPPPPKSSFENLEDEMASLLGRPKSSSSS